jgi:hypothetical protein
VGDTWCRFADVKVQVGAKAVWQAIWHCQWYTVKCCSLRRLQRCNTWAMDSLSSGILFRSRQPCCLLHHSAAAIYDKC